MNECIVSPYVFIDDLPYFPLSSSTQTCCPKPCAPRDKQDLYAVLSQSTDSSISKTPSPCFFSQSDPGCLEVNGVVKMKN